MTVLQKRYRIYLNARENTITFIPSMHPSMPAICMTIYRVHSKWRRLLRRTSARLQCNCNRVTSRKRFKHFQIWWMTNWANVSRRVIWEPPTAPTRISSNSHRSLTGSIQDRDEIACINMLLAASSACKGTQWPIHLTKTD